jgi:hypothetical protein
MEGEGGLLGSTYTNRIFIREAQLRAQRLARIAAMVLAELVEFAAVLRRRMMLDPQTQRLPATAQCESVPLYRQRSAHMPHGPPSQFALTKETVLCNA